MSDVNNAIYTTALFLKQAFTLQNTLRDTDEDKHFVNNPEIIPEILLLITHMF